MKKQAVVGSALAMIGVAAGSLLAPQAASALDFTFSFEEYYGGGVTGLIEGLSEGINACLPTDSCRITVTNNGGNGAPVGPSQTYLAIHVDEAAGFQVVTPAGGNPYILQTSASWPPPPQRVDLVRFEQPIQACIHSWLRSGLKYVLHSRLPHVCRY